MDDVHCACPSQLHIRKSDASDLPALERLYREAFPEEDLVPLLRELLGGRDAVISLVGAIAGQLAGHAAFTRCTVTACRSSFALLGPVAVARCHRRNGFGRALIQHGLQLLREEGAGGVFVLGDPGYYARLGFEPEDEVLPPYAIPDAYRGAWQSVFFVLPLRHIRGTLELPQPWMKPELWGPGSP